MTRRVEVSRPATSARLIPIQELAEAADGRLVGKLPALPDLFAVASRLTADGIPCAMTAVYTPAQALVAGASGLRWVIPYVNRAARVREDGSRLVSELRGALASFDDRPLILAASIKSSDEAVTSVIDGADAISAPLELLRSLAEDDLTASAVEAFAAMRVRRVLRSAWIELHERIRTAICQRCPDARRDKGVDRVSG